MTVTPLLDELFRDADAEVSRRLDDAHTRAAAFGAELEARLEEERTRQLAAVRRDVERETERLRGQATQRANEISLAARHRFVSRVLDAVKPRAMSRTGQPGVIAWVTRNLDAALGCFPPGPAIVRTSPALAPAVRALGPLDGRQLSIREDESLLLGFIVESSDGALGVDATLETLLRAERPRLAIRLVHAAEGVIP